MGLKQLSGMLLLIPAFLFAINSSSNLEVYESMSYVKASDTIPKKNIEAEVTKLEKKSVKLFPNPVKDQLIVGSLNSKKDALNNVQIFDKLGQLIYLNASLSAKDNQIKINTADLKPGVYYLKVNKGSISKFIKI
ncbi:T9SS type A sorting domain-containing protein [Aureibaculum sp. 2210JD6-5]|uniref:T9SS type A sorting domain-containing protein n=1 Tax=Aureibaculum sp. 2210JD6-5 TaxID=3103957 RepID=UPI002AAC859A|nr:T9SS type A sorting domain-containing protein [Aureibaculum sp. 2210JD6-5]MDY7394814.1 T9SS type A sorting domain-containing protein [Aureibaculum sp. 2210JD6-5]